MVYQIRTYNALCTSKKYIYKKEELKGHISTVVEATNKFRKKQTADLLIKFKWSPTVEDRELEGSIEVIRIDPLTCQEWKVVFGEEQPISDPDTDDKAEMITKRINIEKRSTRV